MESRTVKLPRACANSLRPSVPADINIFWCLDIGHHNINNHNYFTTKPSNIVEHSYFILSNHFLLFICYTYFICIHAHFHNLIIAYIYIQAVNPCQRHGFKACRGLRPRTPGCIPTLVLAALHPNISVGCATSQHQCWLCHT